MRPPRVPVVTALAPGCGARTLVAALHARAGDPRGTGADVVVGDAREESLREAASVAIGAGPRPVLAVVRLDATAVPDPARLHALTARYASVTVLPHVAPWRSLARVPDDVATLLARPADRLRREVQGYAAGLREIVAALLGSGQLHRASPPLVVRALRAAPPVLQLVPTLAEQTSGEPTAADAAAASDDRDDEAIERDVLAAQAG